LGGQRQSNGLNRAITGGKTRNNEAKKAANGTIFVLSKFCCFSYYV
jgi:hypothetical protein